MSEGKPMSDRPTDSLTRVGALAEPTRRRLYEYVASQPEPSSREAAAAAVGVAVHSAKFHLDRLVDDGLLQVEFRRLTGRTGPGAGRPSKLYRRANAEVSVSLPPREYDLAGDILAAALERASARGVPVEDAIQVCAREAGSTIGRTALPTETVGLERLAEALAPHGYEPQLTNAGMVLANCPFDRLARDHRTLVCTMNLHLVEGAIAGGECADVDARLAPQEGRCCVTAHPR
jgi:predicted ArsR family transcriptional regulator